MPRWTPMDALPRSVQRRMRGLGCSPQKRLRAPRALTTRARVREAREFTEFGDNTDGGNLRDTPQRLQCFNHRTHPTTLSVLAEHAAPGAAETSPIDVARAIGRAWPPRAP